MEEKELIETFHRMWYTKQQFNLKLGEGKDEIVTQMQATYCKFLVQKNPLDLWVYQEILWDTKPDLIIEMGTASGGTTLFLANQLDLIGNGKIVSVDIDNRLGIVPQHPRIFYIVGDSVAKEVYQAIEKIATEPAVNEYPWTKKKVMLILDDDHTTPHVLKELYLYNDFVTPGQYLIVEDTNVDWPLGFGDGPGLAVHEFLKACSEFEVDKSREKFLMTWNPGGYLRRR